MRERNARSEDAGASIAGSGGLSQVLTDLARWQQRAERLETAASHEREIRLAAADFLRLGFEEAVEALLHRTARVLRADRAYAVLWTKGGAARTYVSGDVAVSPSGLPQDLSDEFVRRSVAVLRQGSPVEHSDSIPAPRSDDVSGAASLRWEPIRLDAGVVGLLGCDSSRIEIYWSAERRHALAALAELVATALQHRKRANTQKRKESTR